MSELNETHKLGDRVIMNHPTLKGVTGQLGESGNIDELNTSTLNSYIDKAVVDAKKKEKAGDKAKSPEVSYKNFRSAAKRLSNVNKARGKVARQEFADKVGL